VVLDAGGASDVEMLAVAGRHRLPGDGRPGPSRRVPDPLGPRPGSSPPGTPPGRSRRRWPAWGGPASRSRVRTWSAFSPRCAGLRRASIRPCRRRWATPGPGTRSWSCERPPGRRRRRTGPRRAGSHGDPIAVKHLLGEFIHRIEISTRWPAPTYL